MKKSLKLLTLMSLLIIACPGYLRAEQEVAYPLPMYPAQSLPPLQFPDNAIEAGSSFAPQMAVYKPEGSGPFPAIVLGPTCAGVGAHLSYWIQHGIQAGYVMMVLDSLSQRGESNICGRRSKVTFLEGTKDALDALEHLGKLPYVDRNRIAYWGYSWGGGVAYLLASQNFSAVFRIQNPSKTRYAATVGFYPVCYHRAWGAVPSTSFMRPDTDRPILSLFAEEDHEEPVAECTKRLEDLQKKGAPVTWHVFPKTAHAWDQPAISGVYTKMPWMDAGGRFFYDKEVTDLSRIRAFEFLAKQFSAPR